MAALTDNSIKPPSTNSSNDTGEGVIIDIGTGDGRFVYQSARENPNKFYIGIDANAKPLEKISMKATRKYFFVVIGLMLLQIAMGIVTAHYAVEGRSLFGLPLAAHLPHQVSKCALSPRGNHRSYL